MRLSNTYDSTILSMFANLKRLKLLDCSTEDFFDLDYYITSLAHLEYLYITIRKPDQEESLYFLKSFLKK